MSYGWPATSFGMNPYGYSPYPSESLAPFSGPNPYALPPQIPSDQAGYFQSPGTIQNAMQTGSPSGHRPLTRKEKIAIIVSSVIGGSALLIALVLAVRHYRKAPQRIEHGATTFGSEGLPGLAEDWGSAYGANGVSHRQTARLNYAEKLKARAKDRLSEPNTDGDVIFGNILQQYAASPSDKIEDLRPLSWTSPHRKNVVEHFVKKFVKQNPHENLREKKPADLFALFCKQGFDKKVAAAVSRGRRYQHFLPVFPLTLVAAPLAAGHAYRFRRS